jgi:hypothetical protein
MKRLSVFLVLLAVALTSSVTVADHRWGIWQFSESNFDIHEYTYAHSTGTWKDDECAAPGGYAVMFYEHANFSGSQTRVCHGHTRTWDSDGDQTGRHCDVPLGGQSVGEANFQECQSAVGASGGVIKDRVTSLKLLSGPFDSRCLIIYADNDHSWPYRQFANHGYFGGDIDNLGPSINFNDRMSSWKLADCVPGVAVW